MGLLRTGVNSKWRRQRQLPLLYDDNDHPMTSEEAAAELMLQNFSAPELGQLGDADQYVKAYVGSINDVYDGRSHH
eukprot:9178061-Karenia_brevis.AAC.1